jgi:hypothetical protein
LEKKYDLGEEILKMKNILVVVASGRALPPTQ